MEMKIVGVTLAAFVSLVVLAAVLVPILDDATETEDKFTNDGYYRMNHYASSDEGTHTISWSYSSPNVMVVDGENMDIVGVNSAGMSILIGTDTVLRAGLAANGTVTNIGYITSGSATFAEVSHSDSLSFSFSSGAFTGTIRGSSISGTYNDLYIPNPNGEFVMKNSTESAYVLADSEILAYGITNVGKSGGGTLDKGISISGDIENLTLTVWRGSSGFTTTDPVVHATEVTSHKDLYSLEKITFTGTVTETVGGDTVTTDTDVTYSYFLVPYEVTAERSVHFTDNLNELLGVIPVLVIVAILLGVIALVIRSKLD